MWLPNIRSKVDVSKSDRPDGFTHNGSRMDESFLFLFIQWDFQNLFYAIASQHTGQA